MELAEHLLNNYNKQARPVSNPNDTVKAIFGIEIIQFIKVVCFILLFLQLVNIVTHCSCVLKNKLNNKNNQLSEPEEDAEG